MKVFSNWIVRCVFVLFLLFPAGPACESQNENSAAAVQCLSPGETRSNIKNIIIVIQENHSFDSYFGNYCKAPAGSDPQCTLGSGCCEAAPKEVSGVTPKVLTDQQNAAYDPDHSQVCELEEINEGKMDRYVTGASCSNPDNLAYADENTVSTYWNYAANYALADRYFQPVAGASSSNDMYFARAGFVFVDNSLVPNSIGDGCYSTEQKVSLYDPTVADLLGSCNVSWAFYAEGYQDVLKDPEFCKNYPNRYDPSDNPFQYYKRFQDDPTYERDYSQLNSDLANQKLPAVSFVKALGNRSEHPGLSTITAGEKFVSEVVNSIQNSTFYRDRTLILVVPDESGGFYDHISPPPPSAADQQPYGPRIPLLAIGTFARKNTVSHATLEHSSIVRFIEWNFLGGTPGQLRTRDAFVNGIGSLLDPQQTGIEVP